jgi:uncharacterized membrane protein YfcA
VIAIFAGFFVGCCVAATGIGGGVILLPLLMLFFHVPSIIAVGTALLFMSITKLWAVLLHWKQKTIDLRLTLYLSIGSIPGALVGANTLNYLYVRTGEGANSFLQRAIGISLILIALLSMVADLLKTRDQAISQKYLVPKLSEAKYATWIGFLGGFLVGATSLGSGSVIILLLLIFCQRSPAILVGTDIFHAMILTTIATLIHLHLNPIDFRLAGTMLCGSVVGVLVGTRLAVALAPVWLRRTLLILAAASGLMLL